MFSFRLVFQLLTLQALQRIYSSGKTFCSFLNICLQQASVSHLNHASYQTQHHKWGVLNPLLPLRWKSLFRLDCLSLTQLVRALWIQASNFHKYQSNWLYRLSHQQLAYLEATHSITDWLDWPRANWYARTWALHSSKSRSRRLPCRFCRCSLPDFITNARNSPAVTGLVQEIYWHFR